jgi:hypothetical protein
MNLVFLLIFFYDPSIVEIEYEVIDYGSHVLFVDNCMLVDEIYSNLIFWNWWKGFVKCEQWMP